MKGSREVIVRNRRLQYRFTVNRNITIVRGDSGTGKTTLYSMIAEHAALGTNSGVQLQSDSPCVALSPDEQLWRYQLGTFRESIVFIDEGAAYISSQAFAAAIRETDNYYVIFSREPLHELPYSVDEIYEIRTSRRYHTFVRRYTAHPGHIYGTTIAGRKPVPDTLLTEDSRSGYRFFSHYLEGSSVTCLSAGSNSAIYSCLRNLPDRHILVIADGAAIGSQLERIMLLQSQYPDRITLCLPESFEWLILRSGVAPIDGTAALLEEPGAFIESSVYFSWERFFTHYLIEHSTGTHFEYSKSRLHSFYLIGSNMERIAEELAPALPKK